MSISMGRRHVSLCEHLVHCAQDFWGQPISLDRVAVVTRGLGSPPPPKPRKRKNEKAILGGIGELGGSGWRGSIRLVKLVWLVCLKRLGIGPKGLIYPKRSKRIKNRHFPYTPCGFYIKNG